MNTDSFGQVKHLVSSLLQAASIIAPTNDALRNSDLHSISMSLTLRLDPCKSRRALEVGIGFALTIFAQAPLFLSSQSFGSQSSSLFCSGSKIHANLPF